MSRSFRFRCIVHLLLVVLYAQGIWSYAPVLQAASAREAAAAPAPAPAASGGGTQSGGTQQLSLFGPKRFTRTWGLFPDCFVETITVPAHATGPYTLRIQNGEPNGAHRVILAAYVEINGQPIVGALDFLLSQHVIERQITLTPGSTATLKVTMWSLPGSYLTLSMGGTNGDTQAPTIAVTSPEAGAVLADATPSFAVTYADPAASGSQGSGLDLATFRATLDGVDRTSLFAKASGGATATLPESLALADGTHLLRVEIKDGAGNPAMSERTFQVLTVVDPPALSITAPAAGALVSSSPIAVSGAVREFAGGAVTVQCRVGATTVNAPVTGENYACSLPLAEGENSIEVSATDTRNQTTRATRLVRLDTTEPAVTITAPLNDSFTTESSISVSGTVVDATAVTVKVNGLDATVTGDQFHLASLPVGTGSTLPVEVVAVDAAGLSNRASVTVRVLREQLTVKIDRPAPGAVLQGPEVDVEGTTSRELSVDVAVNGKPATVQDGRFTARVPVTDGPQTLRAVAHDAAGRTKEHEVSVRIDNVKPAITITQPVSGLVTSANNVVVAGTLEDANGVTLRVQGIPVTVVGGQFSVEVPLGADGPTTLNIEAVDAAGNTTTLAVAIVVDRTRPTLDIVAPTDGAFISRLPVIVRGTVSETNGPTITVDGTPVELVDGAWQRSFDTLPDGSKTFVVVARDVAGNEIEKRVTVMLDTAKPVLTITSPADQTFVVGSHLTVTGTVSDPSAVTVTVNGVAAVVSGQQFEATNVPTGTGQTLDLLVVAEDAAGNRQEAPAITVHVVRTDLTLTITSPVANAVVRGPDVELRGTTSQDVPVEIEINQRIVRAVNGAFTMLVPAIEGTQTLRVTARDGAGRTKDAEVTFRIDTLPPTITITEPAAGLVTTAASVRIAGSVADASTVTVRIGNQELQAENGQFSTTVLLPAEGPVTIPVTVTDAVGIESTANVELIVDRTKPTLTVVAPTDGAVIAGVPILVQGTVQDATATTVTVDGQPATPTEDAWQARFETLPDGSHMFVVIATDAAGNTDRKEVTVRLDTQPPTLTIASPAPGTLTRFDTVEVTGTVADASDDLTVTVNDRVAVRTGGTFTATGVPLGDGDGDKTLVVIAKDASGHTSEARVIITRDSTAPAIELDAPERVTRRESGRAVATVTDANGVAQVVFAIQGQHAATQTEAPFGIDLVVPEATPIGGTFVVTATATDRAGNVTTKEHGVRAAADGAIVGQVLTDATGLPLPEATVRVGDQTRTTDAQGRYTLPTDQASVALLIEKAGMTSVSRVATTASGAGAVPIDARLTPLAAPVTITSGAAVTLTAESSDLVTTREPDSRVALPATPGPIGTIAIDVPAGAVSSDVAAGLTPLSPQGLPELLPLGWSPIVAFDLRANGTVQGALALRVTFTAPAAVAAGSTLTLVQYRALQHAWTVVAREVTVSDALAAAASLPGLGVFALVVPDTLDPPLAVPAANEPLKGVAVQELPVTAASRGLVEPGVIPPTGGVARGQLLVDTSAPLPSGTLVQAEIGETFTLPSGQVASEELRRADLVLYRLPHRALPPDAGATPPPDSHTLGVAFPIAPSRTFNPEEAVEGRVHLDILAGRESVRGVVGGREAVTVTTEDARLVVPADALGEDTAVTLARAASFSSFLPTHGALTPLAELVIDVAGRGLTRPAELSMSAANAAATPDNSFVIVRVDRIDGVPVLQVVALADVNGDRLVARAMPGLPGVTQGGRYLFYRVEGKLAFVGGVTSAGGVGVAAVVSGDRVPFVTRSSSAESSKGRYLLVTLAGTTSVRARVPLTSLQIERPVTVAADGTGELELPLAATVTPATVAPADQTRAVPRHTQITVTASAAINAGSVTAEGVRLLKIAGANSTPVAVRTVLAGSRLTLSIVPVSQLDADTDYRLEVSGLADVHGGIVAVPPTTFRTAAESTPNFSPDKLTFSFPDADGNVTIAAPELSFALGVQFLIINSTTGEVLSFRSLNDGSVNATLRATLDDRLIITISDADGRVTTFTRSQFVDPATGRTAIGPGGGVVQGPDGLGLIVPDGAVASAVTLKLVPVGEDAFPDKPAGPHEHFGSGIQVEAAEGATFNKEVDVVFPAPRAALDAADAVGLPHDQIAFYVYRRVMTEDGEPIYVTVDHARLEGDGTRVVTASFPFSGFFGAALSYMYLAWAINVQKPGLPTKGSVTGHVTRPVFDPGATTPRYVGVEHALVTAVDGAGNPLRAPQTGAYTDKDGLYTLLDDRVTDGLVQVTATDGTDTATMTVTQVQRSDTAALADPALGVLFKKFFLNQIATANLTFPPQQPAPPAPALTIRVMETVEGRRVDTRGLAREGTPLIVGVSAAKGNPATISGVTIARLGGGANAETSLVLHADPALQQQPRDKFAMDVIGTESWTPSQPGVYTVTAVGLPAYGPRFEESITVRVLAAGGGVETVPGKPQVITAQTVPRANATQIPVTVVAEIAFTEPVTNVPDNLQLLDPENKPVDIRIGGVGVDAQGQPTAISDVTSTTIVTALTIEPRVGLSYNTRYRLVLKSGIQDRDDPTPSHLDPFETAFTTFSPDQLGESEQQFSSPGLVVLGDRAFVLESLYYGGVGGQQHGFMHVFDITDPVVPSLQTSTEIIVAPRDIGGEEQEGAAKVAVVTMPRTVFVPGSTVAGVDIQSGPANLFHYDVSGPTPQWIGLASISDGIMDGTPNRVVVKDDVAYVGMSRKGIQVVDLSAAALGDFRSLPAWQQTRRISAPGEPVNPGAVVATISVRDPAVPSSTAGVSINDLKVDDYEVEGQSKRLVLATGGPAAVGLVVVDPYAQTVDQRIVYQSALSTAGAGSLSRGEAIALTRITDRDLAIVGGYGTVTGAGAAGVIAVVDLSPLKSTPRGNPTVLAWFALEHGVGDIVMVGQVAVVSSPTSSGATEGKATLINLSAPSQPVKAGTLTGLASRLAVTADGIVLSTNRSFLKSTPTELDRVRTAALGYMTVISEVKEDPVILSADRKSIEPRTIKYRAIYPNEDIHSSELEILRNDTPISTLQAPLDENNVGQLTLPAGLAQPVGTTLKARLIVNRNQPADKQPTPKARVLRGETFTIDPNVPEITRIGDEPWPAVAINNALGPRLARDADVPLPALVWSGPSTLSPSSPQSTGIYSVELNPTGPAGTREPFRLMLGDTLMASTGPVTVLPGHAASATLRADPPPQSPSVEPRYVPADGKTEITLTLENIRDAFGNLIEDDTPIAWSIADVIDAEEGQLIGVNQSVTQGGRATVRYRAGTGSGYVFVRAAVPVPDGELAQDIMIYQEPLEVNLQGVPGSPGAFTLSVRTALAGLPADGTPVGWILARGTLEGQVELVQGQAAATWVDWPDSYFKPEQPKDRWVNIGAIVGNVVSGLNHDTQRELAEAPPDSGKKLLLGNDTILPPSTAPANMAPMSVMGAAAAADASASASSTPIYPSSTTAYVVGGAPGETVRLGLGTTKFPVVDPIAAYTFDAIEQLEGGANGIAADIYQTLPATVDSGVTVDTTDPARAGTYRFAGGGQVTVADAPAFALTQNFGVSGWVSFDDLTAGQTVVQKAGSYSVQLVTEGGESRLEFAIQSGGQRHRVLSRETVTTGTWYRFAAHFRRGQLALAFGSGDLIALADAAGAADPSTEPIVIGSGFSGRLDEIALYDLSKPAFVTFAGGTTETVITLDDQGRGSVEVVAVATEPGAGSGGGGGGGIEVGDPGVSTLAAAAEALAVPVPPDPGQLAMASQLRQPAIRTFTTQPDNETFWDRFKVEWLKGSQACVEGLATGEGDFWSQQTACDIFVGLLPFTSTPMAGRDLTISGRNLVNGNRSIGNFVKGAFGLIVLGASVAPGVKSLGRIVGGAKAAGVGARAEAALAREAMARLQQALDLPGDAVRTNELARVLAAESGDIAARDALRHLLTMCDGAGCRVFNDELILALERVGKLGGDLGGYEALAKSLSRVAKNPQFGDLAQRVDVVQRMIRALDTIPVPLRLSEDAVDGLAVFVKHTKHPKRVERIWKEMKQYLEMTDVDARNAVEQLFVKLKEGDARFAGKDWWHSFVARGAGTWPSARPTRGFFHHLDRILAETRAVTYVDQAVGNYPGRPDLLLTVDKKLVQREFKAIGAGQPLGRNTVAQLKENVRYAMLRSWDQATRRVDTARLADELERIEYVFRGQRRPDLIKEVQDTVEEALAARKLPTTLAQHLVQKIAFEGRLPF